MGRPLEEAEVQELQMIAHEATTTLALRGALLAATDRLVAQGRIIEAIREAARGIQVVHHPEHDTTDSFADFTGRCDPSCPGCKFNAALAAGGDDV